MKKRILSVLFAAVFALSMVACGSKDAPVADDTKVEDTVKLESSTAGLEQIWSLIPEEEKFPAMGGDFDNMVDGNPGAYKDEAGLTVTLLIPEDQITNTDDVASILHAMNANTFTGVVAHVTSDTKAFADALKANIDSTQWMCGAPEKLIIAQIADGYVCYAYGESMAIDSFSSKLKEAFPAADVMYEEEIVINF